MPHRKSSARQHSKQPNQSKQMGQSSGGKRQQEASGSSRQSGSGSTGMKGQQAAQDIGKTKGQDVERGGLTRDDDSDIESR